MSGKKFTFTFSLVAIFSIMAFLFTIAIVGYNYYSSSKEAYKDLEEKNENIRQSLVTRSVAYLDKASSHLLVLAGLDEDNSALVNRESVSRVMWEQLLSDNGFSSIFLADENGNFLQARRTPAYAIRTIEKYKDKRVDIWDYKDEKFVTTATEVLPASYDPRVREWYTKADENSTFYWTDPYVFASTGKTGITVSHAKISEFGVKSKVSAADITLESISAFLETQSKIVSGKLVIFSDKGDVVATSFAHKLDGNFTKVQKINEIGHQEIVNSFEEFKKNRLKGEVDDAEGKRYIYAITPFPNTFQKRWYLVTYVDKNEAFANINRTLWLNLLISLGILIFAIPAAWYGLSYSIVRPVRELKEISDSVGRLEYENIHHVETSITEFYELSNSMFSMSKAIKGYQERQELLMDSFIKLIAAAIDAKSPYTGGHCERVPEIASMLAKAASDANDGELAEFKLESDDEWREFRIGAWLHDCGKVTTPEYVVDKATKLETIYNRIHEVRARFEVLHRDATIEYYQKLLAGETPKEQLKSELAQKQASLADDFAFIAQCNIGGEFMDPSKQERLKEIANRRWVREFDDRLGLSEAEMLRLKDIEPTPAPCEEPLLADRPEHIIKRDKTGIKEEYEALGFNAEVPEHQYNYGELYNLLIARGTLTNEERFKINEHVIMSIRMLEQLPLTDDLKRIPEYAGSHHETMIGTGYPRGLTKEQISIPARIMAIADIFEALTASDRPYKKTKTLSEAIKIMSFMKKDNHIDAELFDLFLTSGVYKEYALKNLLPHQIDEVDISKFVTKKAEEAGV